MQVETSSSYQIKTPTGLLNWSKEGNGQVGDVELVADEAYPPNDARVVGVTDPAAATAAADIIPIPGCIPGCIDPVGKVDLE